MESESSPLGLLSEKATKDVVAVSKSRRTKRILFI